MDPSAADKAARLPILSSARLRYEPLGPEHAPGLFVALGDPRVWEHLPGVQLPASAEALAERFTRLRAGPPAGCADLAWVNYAVVLAEAPGVPIGRVEATLHERGSDPWAETAYLFHPAHWGRGFATEAMTWFHAELAGRGVRELWACITRTNTRSLSLARRLGYRDATPADVSLLGSYDPGDACLKLVQQRPDDLH